MIDDGRSIHRHVHHSTPGAQHTDAPDGGEESHAFFTDVLNGRKVSALRVRVVPVGVATKHQATLVRLADVEMALIPAIGRIRMLRSWGGVMDMSMDGSPIIDHTCIDGFYLNGGWCYGGFKATPASGWCFAHLLARDEPHEVARAYRLDRFLKGHLIDEKGQGAQPNLH